MSVTGGRDREEERPRRSRWLKVGLIGSLALNLLFVGVAASAAWVFWNAGPDAGRHRAFARAVDKLMSELPEDRREIARRTVQTHRDTMTPLRERLRGARRSVAAAIEAEPFSEARLREALAAMNTVREEMRRSLHENALTLLKHLTQDERKRFLRYMTRKRWRGARPQKE